MAYELLSNKENDYRLPEDRQSVWIVVGNISIYIKREDEGVAVDLYPFNDEVRDSLAGCWATFAEAESEMAGLTL